MLVAFWKFLNHLRGKKILQNFKPKSWTYCTQVRASFYQQEGKNMLATSIINPETGRMAV